MKIKQAIPSKNTNKCLVLLAIVLSSITLNATYYPLPTLSKEKVNQMFDISREGFQERWDVFEKSRSFKRFTPNFSSDEIAKDFSIIRSTRDSIYYENPNGHPLRAMPNFERNQELLIKGYCKAPHLIAFDYNHTDNSYNSSNIQVNDLKFLAMEGPQKPDHVNHLKQLLVNFNVKAVVRLTTDIENGVFKSVNYWKDTVKRTSEGTLSMEYHLTKEEGDTLPYYFDYYAIDNWTDNTGIQSPDQLLKLVLELRKNHHHDLIAVHCSAGVGRTGTFIASYIIIDEIERQLQQGISKEDINLSIEKIVYMLSLQRAYSVGETNQYINLHQLAKLYLDTV